MTVRWLITAGYAALAAAALALELAGRMRRLGLVPLGEVTAAVCAALPGRLVLVLGWAWLGWHLLAR
jgi:hypothetical protein